MDRLRKENLALRAEMEAQWRQEAEARWRAEWDAERRKEDADAAAKEPPVDPEKAEKEAAKKARKQAMLEQIATAKAEADQPASLLQMGKLKLEREAREKERLELRILVGTNLMQVTETRAGRRRAAPARALVTNRALTPQPYSESPHLTSLTPQHYRERESLALYLRF